MTVRIVSKCAAVAMVLGLAACGPGAAYDNLSGGSKDDVTLDAPRPIAPLSISLISSSRPRLKWELTGMATGAVVEMCRTRACDGEVKSFTANGRELVVPEDLAPGIWFWRLRSRADGKSGTKTSPTWEMLVRGPAAHGSSDAPTGSLFDYDGDGIPDLVTIADIDDGSGEFPWPALFAYRGDADSTFKQDSKIDMWQIGPESQALLPITVAGGSDFDGDGFADMLVAGYAPGDGGYIEYEFGGETPFMESKTSGLPAGTMFHAITAAREAGDINGDGYGDTFEGDPRDAVVHLGSTKGPAAYFPLMFSTPDAPPTPANARALAFAAAFDSNADGFSDIAFGLPTEGRSFSPAALAAGKGSLHGAAQGSDPNATSGVGLPNLILAAGGAAGVFQNDASKELSIPSAGVPHAITFASGDFNGDGIGDLAATVEVGTTRQICFWYGDTAKTVSDGPCITAAPYDNLLGEQIIAADLEGDGVDELVAVSSEDGASAKIFRFDGNAMRPAEKVAGLGAAISVIWPGRPGKARWAARSGDGHSLKIFEGLDVVQTLRPEMQTRGFARSIR